MADKLNLIINFSAENTQVIKSEIEKMKQGLKGVADELTINARLLKQGIDPAVRAARDFRRERNRLTGQIMSNINNMETAVTHLIGKIKEMAFMWGGLAFGMVAAAKKFLDYSSEVKIEKGTIQSLAGDYGKELQREIDQLAFESPLDKLEAMKGTRKMLQMGIDPRAVSETMRGLTFANLAFAGGDKNKFKDLSKAYGDVLSKGKLSGEEVRQFANILNIHKLLGEQFGKTKKEIVDMQAKGLITAEMVTETFNNMVNNKSVKAALDSYKGSWMESQQKMSESFDMLRAFIGEKLEPLAAKLVATIQPLLDDFMISGERSQAIVENITKAYENLGKIFYTIVSLLGGKDLFSEDSVKAVKAINDLFGKIALILKTIVVVQAVGFVLGIARIVLATILLIKAFAGLNALYAGLNVQQATLNGQTSIYAGLIAMIKGMTAPMLAIIMLKVAVIAAIIAAIAVLFLLIDDAIGSFTDKNTYLDWTWLHELIEYFTKTVPEFWTKEFPKLIADTFINLFNTLKELFDKVKTYISDGMSNLIPNVSDIFSKVPKLKGVLLGGINVMKTGYDNVKGVIDSSVKNLTNNSSVNNVNMSIFSNNADEIGNDLSRRFNWGFSN